MENKNKNWPPQNTTLPKKELEKYTKSSEELKNFKEKNQNIFDENGKIKKIDSRVENEIDNKKTYINEENEFKNNFEKIYSSEKEISNNIVITGDVSKDGLGNIETKKTSYGTAAEKLKSKSEKKIINTNKENKEKNPELEKEFQDKFSEKREGNYSIYTKSKIDDLEAAAKESLKNGDKVLFQQLGKQRLDLINENPELEKEFQEKFSQEKADSPENKGLDIKDFSKLEKDSKKYEKKEERKVIKHKIKNINQKIEELEKKKNFWNKLFKIEKKVEFEGREYTENELAELNNSLVRERLGLILNAKKVDNEREKIDWATKMNRIRQGSMDDSLTKNLEKLFGKIGGKVKNFYKENPKTATVLTLGAGAGLTATIGVGGVAVLGSKMAAMMGIGKGTRFIRDRIKKSVELSDEELKKIDDDEEYLKAGEKIAGQKRNIEKTHFWADKAIKSLFGYTIIKGIIHPGIYTESINQWISEKEEPEWLGDFLSGKTIDIFPTNDIEIKQDSDETKPTNSTIVDTPKTPKVEISTEKLSSSIPNVNIDHHTYTAEEYVKKFDSMGNEINHETVEVKTEVPSEIKFSQETKEILNSLKITSDIKVGDTFENTMEDWIEKHFPGLDEAQQENIVENLKKAIANDSDSPNRFILSGRYSDIKMVDMQDIVSKLGEKIRIGDTTYENLLDRANNLSMDSKLELMQNYDIVGPNESEVLNQPENTEIHINDTINQDRIIHPNTPANNDPEYGLAQDSIEIKPGEILSLNNETGENLDIQGKGNNNLNSGVETITAENQNIQSGISDKTAEMLKEAGVEPEIKTVHSIEALINELLKGNIKENPVGYKEWTLNPTEKGLDINDSKNNTIASIKKPGFIGRLFGESLENNTTKIISELEKQQG